MANWMNAEAAGRRYRYKTPRYVPRLIGSWSDRTIQLRPGDVVDPIALITTDGCPLRSVEVYRQGQQVLIVFGSRTCPATESAIPGLKSLHQLYGDKIRFVLVAVRAAHAGKALPQPQTGDEKWIRAAALRSYHDLHFDVAVDISTAHSIG